MKAMQTAVLLTALLTASGAVTAGANPAVICAAEEEQTAFAGITYETTEDSVTITGYTSEMEESVEIPAEIGGLPVTKIADRAFSYCTKLTDIVLPDSITEIGTEAFRSCGQLQSAKLPDTLNSIPREMFEECRKLETVSLPPQTETIGDLAFAKCELLAEISIPAATSEIGEDAFTGTAWLSARRAENPFVIVNRILIDGKAAKGDVTIPAEAEIIGAGAFSYNSLIKSVVIPAHVKEICRYGFFYCPALKDVRILNPECIIYDLDGTFSNAYGQNIVARHVAMFVGGAIRGYENSTAQAYAEKHNYPFEPFSADDLRGDFNADGKIGIDDAQNVLNDYVRTVAGTESQMTDAQKSACDINGDGAADVTDAQMILLYYVEKEILGSEVSWETLITG